MDVLKSFFHKKKFEGPSVNDEIAKLVNGGLGKHVDIAKIEKISDSYPPPSNVPNLRVPKIDKIVDKNIRGYKREQNDQLEICQNLITKSLIASTQMLDLTQKVMKENKSLSRNQVAKIATDITLLQSSPN